MADTVADALAREDEKREREAAAMREAVLSVRGMQESLRRQIGACERALEYLRSRCPGHVWARDGGGGYGHGGEEIFLEECSVCTLVRVAEAPVA